VREVIATEQGNNRPSERLIAVTRQAEALRGFSETAKSVRRSVGQRGVASTRLRSDESRRQLGPPQQSLHGLDPVVDYRLVNIAFILLLVLENFTTVSLSHF
jgi:hypothetical protein